MNQGGNQNLQFIVDEAAASLFEFPSTDEDDAKTSALVHRIGLGGSELEGNMDPQKEFPAPSSRREKWDNNHGPELLSSSDDAGYSSPLKMSREMGSHSEKLDEKFVKHSPTSIFEFESDGICFTQDTKQPVSSFGPPLLQTIPRAFDKSYTTLNSSDDLCFDQKKDDDDDDDESTVEALVLDHEQSPAISIRSDDSDLTGSLVLEEVVSTSPKRQVSKHAVETDLEFYKSWATNMDRSADSVPRKPKRQGSDKKTPYKHQRRASLGDTSRLRVPREIICLPPDASPMKPVRQKSPGGRPFHHRNVSCGPGISLLSLREAFAVARLADDGSTLGEDYNFHDLQQQQKEPRQGFSRCLSMDSLPTKPQRKRSGGSKS